MKKLLKLVIGIISSALVAYLISGSCATFLANQAERRDQENIKEANRSLSPYKYGSKTLAKGEVPEYIFEKHGFAVRFPEKPKVTNYGGMVHYEFGAETEQKATYTIFVTTYEKPLLTNEAIEADLKGYLQGRIKTFGDTGKLVTSQEVLFLDHRALDYEYTKEVEGFKSYFKGVHFVVGNMSYTISVVCIEETKPSAYQKYHDFVISFRLTKNY
jgi:hypothetical protein